MTTDRARRLCHVCRRPLKTRDGWLKHIKTHLELLVYTPKENPTP